MRRIAPLVLLALLALACGGEEPPGTDAGLPDAAGIDAGAPDAAASCATEVRCVSDLQCATLPGAVCNPGLTPARCQLLGCGAEGSPCGDEVVGTYSPGGTGDDALCAVGACRHAGPGPYVCRAAPLSDAECRASCEAWGALHGCGRVRGCEALCDLAVDACAPRGGLSDARSPRTCGEGGTAVCSDGELISF